jgi:hypothetical protein
MILIPQPPFFAGLSGYVAELGASYLMADLGLAYTPRPDHAAYLASWLGALRHDPKAIFNAAAQAQAAADWIHAAHKAAGAFAAGGMRRAMAIAPSGPMARRLPAALCRAFRPPNGIPPTSIWWQRSASECVRRCAPSTHPPLAGTAHRVLLRNPYADIGLTCLDGEAAVWIGERIDRDYRIRCEWSDVSGPARLWLASIAPTFAVAAAPRLCPYPSACRSALAQSRLSVPLEIIMSRLPTSGEWREGSLVAPPLIGRSIGSPKSRPWIPCPAATPASARCGRPDLAVMTRRWPTCASWLVRLRCCGFCELSRRCST